MSEFGTGAGPAPAPTTGPAVFNGSVGREEVGTGAVTGGEIQDGSVSDHDDGHADVAKESYSQEEVNKMIQRRLRRQETKLRKELEQQAAEEARKSRMDEVERLRVERDESVQAAKALQQQAENEIMLAKAEAIAASMGVGQDNLKYITRLVDLSDADRSEPETIQAAVSQVLKDVPALAAQPEAPAADGNSLTMPMGRDRTPAAGATSTGDPSPKDLFNRRLRQRTAR